MITKVRLITRKAFTEMTQGRNLTISLHSFFHYYLKAENKEFAGMGLKIAMFSTQLQ